MQSFHSHCFASIIGVLPPYSDTPPPLSLRHSAHMSNDMTSECSAWTAISPKSCSWIIEVDVYLWGPFLPFSWQATLKMQDCEDGKRRGRWGEWGWGWGGVYVNGLMTNTKRKIKIKHKSATDFGLTVAREAQVRRLRRIERHERDESSLVLLTSVCFCLFSWSI